MNVVEYILKPINADELSAVLRRLKDPAGPWERAERRNVELLRSRYTENLPVLPGVVLRQSAGRAHRAGNGAGAGGASGHRPSGRGNGRWALPTSAATGETPCPHCPSKSCWRNP